MEGDHAGLCMDGQVQCRDVAIADQGFRVLRDQVEVEMRQDARRAPSAAHAHDRVDRLVADHLVHWDGARHLLPGVIAVAVQDIMRPLRFQAEIAERFLDQLDGEGFPCSRGRLDQADRVARLQPRRQHDRHATRLNFRLRHCPHACLRSQRQHRASGPQHLSPVHPLRTSFFDSPR